MGEQPREGAPGGGGERTKARSQEQQCTQNGATCPPPRPPGFWVKGDTELGHVSPLLPERGGSLPGPPVVEASSPPQISFPAPALLATWGPKFCLCAPTLCSISGAK